jgi:uncharacterized iron-regulated protein
MVKCEICGDEVPAEKLIDHIDDHREIFIIHEHSETEIAKVQVKVIKTLEAGLKELIKLRKG